VCGVVSTKVVLLPNCTSLAEPLLGEAKMFYSQSLLSKKGPLGHIWMMAHMERKVSKAKIAEMDIKAAVGASLFYF